MDHIKRRKSDDERREKFSVRLPRRMCDDIRARAKAANKMPQSHYVEYVLLNAAHPDPSRLKAIDELKKINHDLARLGNLLNTGLGDGEIKGNHDKMEQLLVELKDTQHILKTKVRAL